MSSAKTRVAILGGGCGGMSAAFWLTSTPALRDRFEVTVYTRGWRLGGKGASGRDATCAQRIEEHGLHLWMGCYENAFRTLRACYDEWRPPAGSPLRTWTDAFTPQLQVTFMQHDGDGWTPWNFSLPRRAGTPGDGAPLSWADRALCVAEWLAAHLGNRPSAASGGAPAAAPSTLGQIAAIAVHAVIGLATWLLVGIRLVLAGITRGLRTVRRFRPWSRVLIVADLGLTMAIGIARDILPYGVAGFDRANAFDFREWLARHGAMDSTRASAPVRALYDLGFAYPGGDATDFANGRGAAGVALRFLFELALGYKGAPLWKMSAGMGDVVFAPMYDVMEARGVQFRFFHRVARLDVADDGRGIGAIVVERQADLKGADYAPLVDVGGLRCWPSQPLWDQLIDGDTQAKEGVDFESTWDTRCTAAQTLVAGVDFDVAVVAFPPDMIRIVGAQLAAGNADWKRMIDGSASVATQAFQLWMLPTLKDLGWSAGPTVLSAFAAPFDTWADMTHLLPREGWTGADIPRSIAYFCGAMPLPPTWPADPIKAGNDDVRRNAAQWMRDNAGTLWPGSGRQGAEPDPRLVVAQYYRCNIDPSERYVQTLPGSVQYRLVPGSRTYANLFLAGDWTTSRYSSGCVEAAVESGMLAAQAIGGEPATIYGQ
ncbi:MAG: FAD-dependent oxidoreductase [Betaproteobacteria bacterium]